MIDPIAVGQTKEYIIKAEQGTDNPTIWIIGALDSMDKAEILSNLSSVENVDDKTQIKANEKKLIHSDFIIVGHGLKGFKNFGDVKFKTAEIDFFDKKKQVVHEDILKMIPLIVIQELANEIWSENKVDEELEKN
jgi:hypothetical protein